jgi:hypothetical protein
VQRKRDGTFGVVLLQTGNGVGREITFGIVDVLARKGDTGKGYSHLNDGSVEIGDASNKRGEPRLVGS